jgi:two-component system response regulator NreC
MLSGNESSSIVAGRRAIRVMIADDHALLRHGLRLLVENQGLEVVAETGDVRELAPLVARTSPDVLLLDLRMPGGSSIEAIAQLARTSPGLRVVVLTMYDDAAFLRSALAAGAAGYVLKRSTHTELVSALETVLTGHVFVDSTVSLESAPLADVTSSTDTLTPREREVLPLLARGLTYKQVGERLHVSQRTVETYRRRLATKLGLRSRADLLRFALEFGLLSPGQPGVPE